MEKLKKIWRLVIPTALVSLPILVLADVNLPPGPAIGLTEIEQLFNTIANFLMVIGIVIAVIFIIWGGIRYMTAGGDDAAVKKAKSTIFNGIIGAAVVLGVGVILRTTSALVTRTFFGG